jgi:hypothetical protein
MNPRGLILLAVTSTGCWDFASLSGLYESDLMATDLWEPPLDHTIGSDLNAITDLVSSSPDR